MALPGSWRPRALPDMIRLGAAGDGGYVVPKRVLAATDAVVGLGLSDDWSFEAAFVARRDVPVTCYDDTVTRNFWIKRLLADIVRLRGGRWGTWAAYRRFFDGARHVHLRQRIGYAVNGDADLHAVFARHPDGRVFLKVDIEGSEYRILDGLEAYPDRISGLAVEFHDVDLMREWIDGFIRRLDGRLVLCHLHANNWAGVDPSGDPLALEATFVAASLLSEDETGTFEDLPVAGLDAPNDPSRPDIPLVFE